MSDRLYTSVPRGGSVLAPFDRLPGSPATRHPGQCGTEYSRCGGNGEGRGWSGRSGSASVLPAGPNYAWGRRPVRHSRRCPDAWGCRTSPLPTTWGASLPTRRCCTSVALPAVPLLRLRASRPWGVGRGESSLLSSGLKQVLWTLGDAPAEHHTGGAPSSAVGRQPPYSRITKDKPYAHAAVGGCRQGGAAHTADGSRSAAVVGETSRRRRNPVAGISENSSRRRCGTR